MTKFESNFLECILGSVGSAYVEKQHVKRLLNLVDSVSPYNKQWIAKESESLTLYIEVKLVDDTENIEDGFICVYEMINKINRQNS